MWKCRQDQGSWIYKAEDDWSWIAKDRPHGDTSDVDDDKSNLDNEEDRVCGDESNVDDDIWHYTDGDLQ